MQIDRFSIDPGPSIYYDNSFRNVLEDHLSFLKTHPTSKRIAISSQMAYKYEFDLFSLLSAHNVPVHLHWLTMRLNGFISSTDATLAISSLIIPDMTTVDHIRQSHMSTRRVT